MFQLLNQKQRADTTNNKCSHYVVVSTNRKVAFIAYNFSKENGISSLEKDTDGFPNNCSIPEFKTSRFLSHTSINFKTPYLKPKAQHLTSRTTCLTIKRNQKFRLRSVLLCCRMIFRGNANFPKQH